MSFPIIILMMLAAGILGGIINFLLPANENAQTGKKKKPWWQCVVLGIGATILIPLFLEIAQSKLLDDVYYTFSWQKPTAAAAGAQHDTLVITNLADTAHAITHSDTAAIKKELPAAGDDNSTGTAKNYLLYFSYCLIAAAAGFRFINMLISNVVKGQELSEKDDQIEQLEKEKEKRVKNGQLQQQQEEVQVRMETAQATAPVREDGADPALTNRNIVTVWPVLPPITRPDDPQKGRFGGRTENNHRRLRATVDSAAIPGFYHVTIIIESTQEETDPLNSNVIIYLHDSFTPSVYQLTPGEFRDGKAIDDEIISYGAFTVGVITDNGRTLLELDLAEDKSFPKEFRER